MAGTWKGLNSTWKRLNSGTTFLAWALAIAVLLVVLIALAVTAGSSTEPQTRTVLVLDLRRENIDYKAASTDLSKHTAERPTPMLVLLRDGTTLPACPKDPPGRGEEQQEQPGQEQPGQEQPGRGQPGQGREQPSQGPVPDATAVVGPDVTLSCSLSEREPPPTFVSADSGSSVLALANNHWDTDVELTGGTYVYIGSLEISGTSDFGSILAISLLLSTFVGAVAFVFLRPRMRSASSSVLGPAASDGRPPTPSSDQPEFEIRRPGTAPGSVNTFSTGRSYSGVSTASNASYPKVQSPLQSRSTPLPVGTSGVGRIHPPATGPQERGIAVTFVDFSGGYVDIDGLVVWAATSSDELSVAPGDQVMVVTANSASGIRVISSFGT